MQLSACTLLIWFCVNLLAQAMLTSVYICDAIRTPFCAYGGALASLRADDLAANPLAALMVRNPQIDWEQVSDLLLGCANQAGEGSHNIARMAGLLAGLPPGVSAGTCNRLCGSGMEAIGQAARSIRSGETPMMIAGGIEAMSRAPYVMSKAEKAFSSDMQLFDTTFGWHFVNRALKAQYGIGPMADAAENVATALGIDRHAQDRFAAASLDKARRAQQAGYFVNEITPVTLADGQGDPVIITADELTQPAPAEALVNHLGVHHHVGTVTTGDHARTGDGACALLLANEKAAHKNGLLPKARVLGMATAGVPPQMTGIGPATAARKLLVQTGLAMDQIDIIELHEAYAAQVIAVLRDWGLRDDDARVNPNGGAIALGHPLGASGARLVTTAMYQLHRTKTRYALCAMCIDVGQGIAMIIERV